MEQHILREGNSSRPISSSGGQGVPTLASPCKPYRQRRPNASDRQRVPGSTLDSLHSKCDRVVITWSPSGCIPVGPDCPDALPYPCLLITTWQLVKEHRVTRNEPKIHVICYITLCITRHQSFVYTQLSYQTIPFLTINRVMVDLGATARNEYSAFPKAPTLLDPHYQIVCVISRTQVRKSLIPLPRRNQYILQPQLIGLYTIW